MADFHPCLICQSYSQANLSHYTSIINSKLIKDMPYAHLRYLLGDDHPSQTTNHTMSLYVDTSTYVITYKILVIKKSKKNI